MLFLTGFYPIRLHGSRPLLDSRENADLTTHQTLIQSSDLLRELSRYLIECFYCQTAVALKMSHDFHAFTDFLRVVGLRRFKVSKHIQVTSRPTSPPLALLLCYLLLRDLSYVCFE